MRSSSKPVAFISGGASGIGWATAQVFARNGYHVAIGDIDALALQAAREQWRTEFPLALFLHLDVTSEHSCAESISRVKDSFGRLDCAFNNAGIAGYPLFTADHSLAQWRRVIDVNLTGVFNCLKVQIPMMLAQGRGAIVNTASVMGVRGAPAGSAYCAAKHGVIGITQSAAQEYGRDGIRINAICPGYTETPMLIGKDSFFPDKKIESGLRRGAIWRLAKPSEVAEAAYWLCSDSASYVTGAAIPIDGGYLSS